MLSSCLFKKISELLRVARPLCYQWIYVLHDVLALLVYPAATAYMKNHLAVTDGEILNDGSLCETVRTESGHLIGAVVKLVKVDMEYRGVKGVRLGGRLLIDTHHIEKLKNALWQDAGCKKKQDG